MISPQVAKEVGNRIGLVEEVEWKQRQDDLGFFMRVRVAMPIAKPIRRGAFITGSDGIRTWVKFKYERLSCSAITVVCSVMTLSIVHHTLRWLRTMGKLHISMGIFCVL